MIYHDKQEKISNLEKTVLFIFKYKYFFSFISIAFIAWCMCFKMINPKWDGEMPHVTSSVMTIVEV